MRYQEVKEKVLKVIRGEADKEDFPLSGWEWPDVCAILHREGYRKIGETPEGNVEENSQGNLLLLSFWKEDYFYLRRMAKGEWHRGAV